MGQYPDPYDVHVAAIQFLNGDFVHAIAFGVFLLCAWFIVTFAARVLMRSMLGDVGADVERSCVPAARPLPAPLTPEQVARQEAEAELSAWLGE